MGISVPPDNLPSVLALRPHGGERGQVVASERTFSVSPGKVATTAVTTWMVLCSQHCVKALKHDDIERVRACVRRAHRQLRLAFAHA